MIQKRTPSPTLANVMEEEKPSTEGNAAPEALRKQVLRLEELQARSSPWAQFELQTVVFANANADVDIAHSLKVLDPENVFWLVVSIDKDATIYKDGSASRRAWDAGVIRLRSSTSATTATLLLLVRRP